jgi:tRNA pseudouridine55 synthase
MISGLLNLTKPSGITSRRVVDRIQRLVRPESAGHAGTLDPLANGVLVVCIGQATRLIEYVQRMPKTYEATFLLGRSSETEDIEGTVVELIDPPRPTADELARAATALVGTILQRPPAYSALKVQGRRAYDLARRGETVELQPRPIEVYALDVLRYDYPELHVRIRCGSGTYVRSLGRDLAESLGTGAVMSALTRTAIGRFTLAEACDAETLTTANLAEHLQPPSHAVDVLPRMTLDEVQRLALWQGKKIAGSLPNGDGEKPAADEAAAFDASGKLVAIVRAAGPNLLAPSRNFA